VNSGLPKPSATSASDSVSKKAITRLPISIPENWGFRRLKFVADLRYGLGQPPPEMPDGIPLIRATNIDAGRIVREGMVYVDPECVPASRNAFLSAGEIIIVRSGALTGDSAIVTEEFDGSVAGFDVVITPRHIHHRFLAWTLLTPFVRSGQLDLLKARAAQPHLNVEEVGSVVICLPPIEVQSEIADYLDGETADIDALVTNYADLIAALEERRSAFVTNAVTKGVTDGIVLKESQVDWLGNVPDHWKVVPLKFCIEISSGSTPDKGNTEFWQDGDIPWASAKDLKVPILSDTEDHITVKALATGVKIVPENVVLIVVRGMILARLLPVVLTGKPMAINQDLKALQPKSMLRAKYLAFVLRSLGKAMIATADTAGHGTKVLRTEEWTRFYIPVPPMGEQDAIITLIDAEEDAINALVVLTKQCIEVCQERRSAVISAAVTGQIDVKAYKGALAPEEIVV
jgi:restriction endonuclease S subunit